MFMKEKKMMLIGYNLRATAEINPSSPVGLKWMVNSLRVKFMKDKNLLKLLGA